MDDTDIFTLNKLGQIALSMKQLDVAQIALEKVLCIVYKQLKCIVFKPGWANVTVNPPASWMCVCLELRSV